MENYRREPNMTIVLEQFHIKKWEKSVYKKSYEIKAISVRRSLYAIHIKEIWHKYIDSILMKFDIENM